jgi:hypothetical protein
MPWTCSQYAGTSEELLFEETAVHGLQYYDVSTAAAAAALPLLLAHSFTRLGHGQGAEDIVELAATAQRSSAFSHMSRKVESGSENSS